jgi:hypothetical protein
VPACWAKGILESTAYRVAMACWAKAISGSMAYRPAQGMGSQGRAHLATVLSDLPAERQLVEAP